MHVSCYCAITIVYTFLKRLDIVKVGELTSLLDTARCLLDTGRSRMYPGTCTNPLEMCKWKVRICMKQKEIS